MTLAAEPEIIPPIEPEAKSGAGARLLAALGGLAVLAGAALASLGTVALALIVMAVVGGVQRRRGRALTRSGHWLAACATMAAVMLAVIGIGFAAMPRGSMDAAKRSMDSSSAVAAKQPPPAWVQKLYPQYSQARATAKPPTGILWATTIIGVGMVVTFFGTLLGTLGWGAAMLLGLALNGRWPGARGESVEQLTAPRAAVAVP
jgi:hypothetical protein